MTAVGTGYDSATKLQYIILRNSWGTGWGEAGYMRIKYDPSNREYNSDMLNLFII